MKDARVPKTIQRWIDSHKHLIDEYHMECDGYDENYYSPFSIWLYLKPGLINYMTETHCIHASKVVDFMQDVRYIEPCDCDRCKQELVK
jgi:hypothetical protein